MGKGNPFIKKFGMLFCVLLLVILFSPVSGYVKRSCSIKPHAGFYKLDSLLGENHGYGSIQSIQDCATYCVDVTHSCRSITYFYQEKICLLHATAINESKAKAKLQKSTKAFHAWMSCGEEDKIGSCDVTKYEATMYNRDTIQQKNIGKVSSAVECIEKCLVQVTSCKSVSYGKSNGICIFHSSTDQDGLEYNEKMVYVVIKCAIPVVSTKPVITEIGPTFLNVQWDSATDVYRIMVGYRLEYKVISDMNKAGISNWSDELQCTSAESGFQAVGKDLPHDGIRKIYGMRITDLKLDTFYVIRVVAIDRRNNMGHPSPEVEGRTSCLEPSAPPNEIKVASNVQNFINVSWMAPKPDTWQCSNIMYVIQFKEGSNPEWSHRDISSTNIDFQTKPHTTWTFQLRTKNKAGNSKWSDEIQCTSAESAPSQVRNVQGQAIGHDRIRITWEVPLDQNGVIRHYTVSWILKPPVSCPVANVQPNANDVNDVEIIIKRLKPAFEYEIKVRAKTVVDGPDSAPVSVTTLESAPAKPPATITATQVTRDAATISWDPPPCEDCNGQLTQYDYELERLDAAVADRRKDLVDASDNEVKFRTLIPNSKYKIRIRALTAEGPGPYSEFYEFTTRPGVPSPPRDLRIDGISSVSITISFLPPSEAQGVVDNYRIHYKIKDEPNWREEITKTIDELPCAHAAPDDERLCLQIIDLNPNKEYVIQVAAHTQGGEWGNPSMINQLTVEPPIPQSTEAPEVSERKKGAISVRWQPLDRELMKYADGYIIEYKTKRETGWKQSSVIILKTDLQPDGLHSGMVQNLKSDTLYCIRFCVTANNKRGNPSPEVEASTLCGAPGMPPKFKAIAIRCYAIQVKWQEPHSNTWHCSRVAFTIKYTNPTDSGEITINAAFEKSEYIFFHMDGHHDFNTEPDVEWTFQMRTQAVQDNVTRGASNWSPQIKVKSAAAPTETRDRIHNCDVIIYKNMKSTHNELSNKDDNFDAFDSLEKCIAKCLKHYRPCRAVNSYYCHMFENGISDLRLDNKHEVDNKDSHVVISKCDEIQPSPVCVECGIQNSNFAPNIVTRVLGGSDANPHSWPWQIRLVMDNNGKTSSCGAILIRIKDDVEESDVVITAAHCVTDEVFDTVEKKMKLVRLDPSQLFLIAGDHSKIVYAVTEQHRAAIDFVVHHEYKTANLDSHKNDIALILLESSFKFSDTVRPICLPTQGEGIPEGKTCVGTGWGVINLNGVPAIILKQVAVQIHSASYCKSVRASYSEKEMICAGKGTKASSEGDSGGPLQCKSDSGKWMLYGVVSFGTECKPGVPRTPAVYTRVTNYVDWIKTEAAKLSKLG